MSTISWALPANQPLQIWQMKSGVWGQQLGETLHVTSFNLILTDMKHNEELVPVAPITNIVFHQNISTALDSLASCRQEENSQQERAVLLCLKILLRIRY